MMVLTTTAPCSRRLLNDSLKWGGMKKKPCSCNSVSISKGKLVEKRLYIDGEVIPSNVEKLEFRQVIQIHTE